jgi:hypothetical protein
MDSIWQQLPIELIGVIANKMLEDIDRSFSKQIIVAILIGKFSCDNLSIDIPLYRIKTINVYIRSYTTLRLHIGDPIPAIIKIINGFKYVIDNKHRLYSSAHIDYPLFKDQETYRWILERILPVGIPKMFKTYLLLSIIVLGLRDYYDIYVGVFGRLSKEDSINITKMARWKMLCEKGRRILDDMAK